MSAPSLPQIEGFVATGRGFRDGFRSTTNGFIGWRMRVLMSSWQRIAVRRYRKKHGLQRPLSDIEWDILSRTCLYKLQVGAGALRVSIVPSRVTAIFVILQKRPRAPSAGSMGHV